VQITIIGHATVLVEIGGLKIITDPYFDTWGNIAYKRLAHPTRTREALVDVDLVLASHNHWDHIDGRYLRMLGEDVPVLAPRRTSWVTRLYGAKRVTGVGLWESQQFGSVTVTPVPALHITPTIGFIIRAENRQVYYAGDTFYGPFMRRIGQRFALDVALMPVTTFRIPMTLGERSAVRAVRDLKPATVIPIHLGLQPRFPLLRTNHTPQGFERRLREAGLETNVVRLPEGETMTFRRRRAKANHDTPSALGPDLR
jgi:L-ascorbate metabolism protein UlaG (beta-lactamase superfamily)